MVVTMKDMAKKAGVATSTVSRIISDHPSISEATKKKARKIMDELGYIPNMTARNLGKCISSAIGIILPPLDSEEQINNSFYLEIMEATNEEARSYDMATAITAAENFELLLENVQRIHLQKQVDGFILVYSNSQDPVIDYLYQNHTPFTLIGRSCHHENEIICVDGDSQFLGKQTTEFLIQNRHKNTLFVTNTTHESLYFERYFSCQEAVVMVGLPALSNVVLEHPEDYLSFEKTLKKNEVTALVVIDDISASRMMQLAQIYGCVTPEILSVISFGNSIFLTLTHPHLTSIDINISELERVAMQKLRELIHEESSSGAYLVAPHHLTKKETAVPLENPY